MVKSSSIYIAFFLTVCCSAGCMTTSYNTATGERELIMYSTEKEVKLGRKIAAKFEKKCELCDDEDERKRIDDIGQRVAAVSDCTDLKYYFKIIKDEEVNALALPGGYIYISSGLIEIAERDDEIAAVLAHEVGHVVAKHSVKKMQGDFLFNFLTAITLIGSSDTGFHRGKDFAYLSVLMQYSRDFEKEADVLSVRYLKAAGYDPYAALSMLEKLEKTDSRQKRRRYSYFRSHPPIDMRKALIKKEITGELDYEGYLDLLEGD